MSWPHLLSDLRFARREGDPPKTPAGDSFRSPFETDFDRIVYSGPFRRLSRKTQVHPMAMNDQVHTRLTHSLEVASVGRSLGHRLGKFLRARNDIPDGREADIVWIIQAACLAHDIGNPPFGHAGEYAIREWVKGHPDEVFGNLPVSDGLRADWEIFEGNAQGFRIAARGDNPAAGYLRLTFATLGAMIKYPWDSTDPRARQRGKFNVFSSEREMFWEMAERMGLNMGGARGVVRHPLSFLSEAADDICYRILDLEDAAELGILEERRVREILLSMFESASYQGAPVAVLRGEAIQALINGVWRVFERDYPRIMNGDREEDLKSSLEPSLLEAVEKIKRAYTEIFADRTKVAAELGAYKTLGRIIKAVCFATRRLAAAKNYRECGFLAQRCLELAWGERYAVENEARPYEWWLHQVMDYVSGLTDNYSRQLSREIEGT